MELGSELARAHKRELGLSSLLHWDDGPVLAPARDRTGYDCGDEFNSPDEVRAYMQLENLGDLADFSGPDDFTDRTGLHQVDLDHMADVIIRNRSHCTF